MYVPTMEVIPVKEYIPEELTEQRLDYEEAEVLKLGMEDSELEKYYRTGDGAGPNNVEVLSINEANNYSNVQLPDRVIEKTPKDGKEVNEIGYGILAEELGAGVPILYVRERDDEIRYGMEYLEDAGQFKDVEFNGFRDFLDYSEAVAESYAPLYWGKVMHEDLIGQRGTNARLPHTPYLRNIMVTGSKDKAYVIDFEDAHLEGEPSLKTDSKHIHEMQIRNTDHEYEAVFNSLVSEALNEIEFLYDRVPEQPIQKTDMITVDSETGLDRVDTRKLTGGDVSNQDFNSLVRRLEEVFEEAWSESKPSTDRFYRNQSHSTIDTDHERQKTIDEAVRVRLKEDIEPTVEQWIDDLC